MMGEPKVDTKSGGETVQDQTGNAVSTISSTKDFCDLFFVCLIYFYIMVFGAKLQRKWYRPISIADKVLYNGILLFCLAMCTALQMMIPLPIDEEQKMCANKFVCIYRCDDSDS